MVCNNRNSWLVVALLALTLIIGPASARQRSVPVRSAPMDIHVPLARAPVAVLVEQLGLTAAQRSNVERIRADTKAQMEAAYADMHLRPRQRINRQNALIAGLDSKIIAALTPAERAKLPRLNSYLLRMRAMGILWDAIPDLKLTAAQNAKLAAIGQAAELKLRRTGNSNQQRSIAGDAAACASAVLTPMQKNILRDYVRTHPGAGKF